MPPTAVALETRRVVRIVAFAVRRCAADELCPWGTREVAGTAQLSRLSWKTLIGLMRQNINLKGI